MLETMMTNRIQKALQDRHALLLVAVISVNVSTASAPITVEGLNGDIGLSSETGQITLQNVVKSHVRVRSMTAGISLKDVTMSRVDLQSAGGAILLNNVSGQRVTAG